MRSRPTEKAPRFRARPSQSLSRCCTNVKSNRFYLNPAPKTLLQLRHGSKHPKQNRNNDAMTARNTETIAGFATSKSPYCIYSMRPDCCVCVIVIALLRLQHCGLLVLQHPQPSTNSYCIYSIIIRRVGFWGAGGYI